MTSQPTAGAVLPDAAAAPDRTSPIDRAARSIAMSAGLTAITLRRMAATSGLPPATVASHEPSMGALAGRTFSDLAHEEIDDMAARLVGAASPLDALKTLVESLLGPAHDLSKTIWADAWSTGRHNDFVATAAREAMLAWQSLLVEILVAGAEAGQFSVNRPDLAAQQFFALIDSTTAYALVGYLDSDARSLLVTRSLEVALGLPEGTF
ncbi:TetR/AcrR family transcriptional regulator [Frondihabitans australicus]|nr:TetR family transcriptional regulator [Frondihabitans australicus]